MNGIGENELRIAAALSGALAGGGGEASSSALEMLAVAESLATRGALDLDDLRSRGLLGPSPAGVAGLLARAVPFGLASPLDRPRLRRDAYRCAAAAGADEGSAVTCVATALVAADLLRFDAGTTAIRVRQSLLEDAPMALLQRFNLLTAEEAADLADDDGGAILQVALSALTWGEEIEVSAVAAALRDRAPAGALVLAAAFAGAATGRCDLTIDEQDGSRSGAAARALAGAIAAGAAG